MGDYRGQSGMLFNAHRKVLIGVVHLPPLPGSPRWRGKLAELAKRAVADAKAYQQGGAHAVFVENFGDAPFTKGAVSRLMLMLS